MGRLTALAVLLASVAPCTALRAQEPPQLADQNAWTLAQFLEHASRYSPLVLGAEAEAARHEAMLGKAQAYRHLGQETRERQALQRFLDKFPKSSLSGKARLRLSRLQSTSSR